MAQFGVYRNPNRRTAAAIPYLLDLQCDLLASISTRVVAPLARADVRGRPAERLNPTFEIEGVDLVMLTEQLAGVQRTAVGDYVTSLAEHRDEIIEAVDFLVLGY